MSLDIYLEDDFSEPVRPEIYWANITHNLGAMARAAGIYEILWHPPTGTIARELIEPLRTAIERMEENPLAFSVFDSPNGWGTYKNFVPWLRNLLCACEENPTATIRVSI